jgi:hypothetical protein
MSELADYEDALAAEAAKDGIEFEPHQFEWASEPGHLAVAYLADQSGNPDVMQRAEIAVPPLEQMFGRLKGLTPVLHSCRVNKPYMAVLVHLPTATIVELDDALHFTTGRLTTLDLYPPEVPLGFDIKQYKELCREHAPVSDRWRYGLASKMFGFHGLQNERAYQDAVRDLASWVMGFSPLIRIPAIDGDGVAAYARSKDLLLGKLAAK